MRRSLAAILAASLFSIGASAQVDELVRIGVIDLESETVPAPELRILSDRLRVELVNTGEFQVLERERMDLILREQGFQQSGCVATECAVEIGQLLGTEKMIGGRVGKVGDIYTMTLRMVDVETGALERSAVRDCECALQDILTGVVAQVAAELAGLAWTPPPSVSAQPLEVGEGVGILFVESTPAGGRIFINGRPSRETTPATLRNLPAGEHVVRVVREHLVAEERVRVVRDDLTKVSMPLQSGAGSLFIESDPPGADVRIDGTPRGTAPTLIREIPAGPHTISIHADDHLPWEEDIVIEFSRQTEIPVTLQPAGYVTLAVEPPDARVWLDDREISGNQRSRFAVAVGEHRVVARKVDYVPWGETIEIGRGETRRLNARLEWTQEYLQRVEAERQIAAAHRRATMKRTARWVSLGAAVVAGGLAYKYNSDAQSAYDEASEAHVGYRDATTTADAAIWRAQIVDADDRGDSAASKRNALFAVSGGLIGLGVTLCVF